MQPSDAVVEFLYSRELAPKSKIFYSKNLDVFATWCAENGITSISDITAQSLRKFLDAIRERISTRTKQPVEASTVHAYARSVRALLNWAVREDLVAPNLPRKLVMPKREVKVVQTLTTQQFDRLMRAAERTATPTRDRAILAMLLDTGIRADELCTLTLDNTHLTIDDAWLRVHGKGDKWRDVGLGSKSRQLLHRYIHRERSAPSENRVVFVGKRGMLTVNGLDQLIYRLRDDAGAQHFSGVRVSAHTFRHTYACTFIEQGGDIYKLSRLLGHTSIVVTENYLRAFNARTARRGGSVLDNL